MYFIVLEALFFGWVFVNALKHLRHGVLITTCPCTGVIGLLIAGLLYANAHYFGAALALFATVYWVVIMLLSLRMQSHHQQSIFDRMITR